MKKIGKSLLAVLLSVCLLAGMVAVPANAAPDYLEDDIDVILELSDFDASGKCILDNASLTYETSISINPSTTVATPINVINNTGVALKYSMKFWHGCTIVDRFTREAVAPEDVFAPGSIYITPNSNVSFDQAVWNLFNFDTFDPAVNHELPHLFYVEEAGGDLLISGNEPANIYKNTFVTEPWKGFNIQGSSRASVNGNDYDAFSTRVIAADSEDNLMLHVAEAYERNPDKVDWDKTKFPFLNSYFVSGYSVYWDPFDSGFNWFSGDLYYDYVNSQGVDGPTDPQYGGLELDYWVAFEIEATIPQVEVKFYTDKETTALLETWYVNAGKSLLDILKDGDYDALPNPGPKDGKEFKCWECFVDGKWVQLTDAYQFNTAGLTLIDEDGQYYYDSITLRAAYEGDEEKDSILVRFMLDKDTYYKKNASDTEPYTWVVKSGDTVSSLPTSLPTSNLPAKADGSTFSHWEFVVTDANGNVLQRVKVDDSFEFDPDTWKFILGEDIDEDYVCNFYAVYAASTTPTEDDNTWLYALLGGGLLGGAVLGISGIGVAAAAVGSTIVGGLITVILSIIGYKLCADDDCPPTNCDDEEDPKDQDGDVVQCGDMDEDEDEGETSGDSTVKPPNTGDSLSPPLMTVMFSLFVCAAWALHFLKRRREEDTLQTA